jgi:hypothetical protein
MDKEKTDDGNTHCHIHGVPESFEDITAHTHP